MNDELSGAGLTRFGAVAEIERLDAASVHHLTPCGEGRMVWREWGTGPTVVFFHGGFGSWLHWIRNVEAIAAAGYRVLAADTPGLGDSAEAPEPVSPQTIGQAVFEGLTRLLLPEEGCHVVAFSFGGVVSSQVAPKLGKRLRSLTLVGASGFGIPRTRPVDMIRRTPDMTDAEREAAQRHNVLALMLDDPANLDELALEIQARNDARARVKSRRFSLGASLRDALPDISGPVNGIWGENDVTASPDIDSRRAVIATTHPDTDFRIIPGPGAGHWIAYEASVEFNRVLVEMLDRHQAEEA